MINRDRKIERRSATAYAVVCLFAMLLPLAGVVADEQPAQGNEDPGLLGALGNSAKVSLEDLGEQRAKANLEFQMITINDQELNGAVSGNVATGNVTGDNIISSGAFTDVAGFTSTVQNSGNNVLIQNSTIINVALEP